MTIERGGLHCQFDVAQPAHPQRLFGAAGIIDRAELPDAAVGREHVLVGVNCAGNVGAANFLLAFNKVFEAHGQLAQHIAHRGCGGHARDELALVVADAPRVQVIADAGEGEGRRVPQLQGFGGLHIVMIVEEQGAVAAAAVLPKDDGAAAGG